VFNFNFPLAFFELVTYLATLLAQHSLLLEKTDFYLKEPPAQLALVEGNR
jgi:hypothetical protein